MVDLTEEDWDNITRGRTGSVFDTIPDPALAHIPSEERLRKFFNDLDQIQHEHNMGGPRRLCAEKKFRLVRALIAEFTKGDTNATR